MVWRLLAAGLWFQGQLVDDVYVRPSPLADLNKPPGVGVSGSFGCGHERIRVVQVQWVSSVSVSSAKEHLRIDIISQFTGYTGRLWLAGVRIWTTPTVQLHKKEISNTHQRPYPTRHSQDDNVVLGRHGQIKGVLELGHFLVLSGGCEEVLIKV